MIFFIIEQASDPFSVITGDPFPFSVSDRNKGTRVKGIMDQFMDLFGIVSFVHDIKMRRSGPVTLFEEFFSVRNIMDRVLGDLETGDDLFFRVN
jgi:hypothetical protein